MPSSSSRRDIPIRKARAVKALSAALLCLVAVWGFVAPSPPEEGRSESLVKQDTMIPRTEPAVLSARASVESAMPIEPGFPAEIRLMHDMQGWEAIEALGTRLPEVAAFYGKTPEQLQEQLKADHCLKVNRRGELFYACPLHAAPNPTEPSNESAASVASIGPTDIGPFDTSQAFLLHSRPGASRVIYLDFDGHTDTTPGGWEDGAYAPVYNISGNSTAIFEDDERIQIIQIWQRVAEDYAMYDIDVTTEEPGVERLRKTSTSDAQFGMRCCIGGSGSLWYGANVGGVALTGSFDAGQDVPCWVFPVGGTGFNAKNVADAASHEVGHTLGLAHDGIEGVTGATTGQGNWAPIMGVSYSKPITQWDKGEFTSASNTQDDLAVMLTQGAVYRPDDHGGTTATATKLSADSNSASVSGVIERNTDLDFFRIDAVTGSLVCNIKPAPSGANLRLEVKLYDSAGTLLQTATSADVSGVNNGTQQVTLTRSVTAGVFYVSVDGIGNGDPLVTGYSDYGSLGQYTGTISGVVPGGFTWTVTTSGTMQWNTTGNWASGTVPNAAGVSVRVNNDIGGDQTIQLASAYTVGSLYLGDANSTHAFAITPNGGSLVFNNSGITASLSKTSGGNDSLSVPVSLVDALVLTQSASGTLSFSGGISGSGALTKEGAGTVVFASANAYTGITALSAGVLRLDNSAGLPGGIDNTVGSGESALSFKGGVLGLASGDFTRQIGTGAGQLDWDPDTGGAGSGGFAAFGADREVRLNNGLGSYSWATQILGSGSILILSHPTATHTLNFRNGISFSNAKRTVQVEDGAAAVDAMFSGSLVGTAATTAGLNKTGPGVLSLTNTNTYPGSTTVSDGVLRLQNAAALPSGNLELTGGGVLGLGAGDFTARTIGTGVDQVQWLGSGGFAAFGATRAVKFSASSINWHSTGTNFIGSGRVLILSHDAADATLDWQQPISLAGALRTVQVEDGSAVIDAKMSGVIAGGSSGTSNDFYKTGAGTLAFTAQNTYWGDTVVNAGTLMIGDGGTTGSISQNAASITVEPGATLAVNRSDTVTQGTNALKVAVSGDGGFTQAGTGNTVLMLANTYIGPTTLEAGTLTLGAAGVLPDASLVSIGSATLATGTFAETAGKLDPTAAATVQLAAGTTLAFADSSAVDWTGGTLTLTGTFVSGSSLRFGTSATALTTTQLSQISATGYANFALDANGYLTAMSTSGFAYWATVTYANGTLPTNQRGPNDDFDQDGVVNLLEFALAGRDPTLPNGPSGTLTGLTLSFTKRNGISGVTYAIEQSSDLGPSAVWTEVTGPSYLNNATTISYTMPSGPTAMFVRLRVTQP